MVDRKQVSVDWKHVDVDSYSNPPPLHSSAGLLLLVPSRAEHNVPGKGSVFRGENAALLQDH